MIETTETAERPKRRWHQFSLRTLLIFMAVVGCGLGWLGIKLNERPELTGQPSWFPLGNEVYHSQDRFQAERGLLAFQPETRWFVGLAPVSRPADDDNSTVQTEEAVQAEPAVPVEDVHLVKEGETNPGPSPLPPKQLNDLPVVDQGASLSLSVSPADSPDQMRFSLTLKAAERTIRREVEHRWTNTLPFLFAFYADGEAVSHDLKSFGKSGGVNSLEGLVETGDEKKWSLLVDMRSLGSILEQRKPSELAIVAVFCERQHEGLAGFQWTRRGIEYALAPHNTIIVVRSNVVRLKRSGDQWLSESH